MIFSWTISDPIPLVHKNRYVNKPQNGSSCAPRKPGKPRKSTVSKPRKFTIAKPIRCDPTKLVYPKKNQKDHYVYVIHTTNGSSSPVFYTGYTIDLSNRLRQHNKLKSGGAKYTSRFSGWQYLCFISGFKGILGKTTALQCEYKLKKQSGAEKTRQLSKRHPIEKRVARIASHLHRKTFTNKSVEISSLNITINWVNKRAWEQVSKLQWPENVSHRLRAPK